MLLWHPLRGDFQAWGAFPSPWFLAALPTSAHLLPKETMQINHFVWEFPALPHLQPQGDVKATLTLLGHGNSWPQTLQSGVLEQGASGGDSALLETTRLSGIA